MLQRHKVPTIFNIYMLDVICCALGCVVLLWQVAHQEAEEQTALAKSSHAEAVKLSDEAVLARKRFERAQSDLLSAANDKTHLQALLADWRDKHDALAQALAKAEKERANARNQASALQLTLDKTQASLTLSAEQLKKLEADLAKLLVDQKNLKVDLTGSKKLNLDLLAQITSLKKDIAAKEIEIDLAGKNAKEQTVALKLSQDTARSLQKLLDALRDDSKDAQAKLKTAELQLKMREQDGAKELADLKMLLATLAKEKDSLNKRVLSLQAEADQRFAGIPLTGENVVFLIDISGSMIMKDEATEDPDKWPFLCETLMKLMKSIPSLQRFQIILFSDKTSYLFGNRDVWLKYEGPETAKLARDSLRKVRVEGGTNMHDAFDEAFRYRKIKLDTIYLFSDGLPNLGEGLPPVLRNASETQRSQHLGKYVRDKLKSDWNRTDAASKESPVRVNAVGFFFESPDVGAFLWALAREHRGSFVGLR